MRENPLEKRAESLEGEVSKKREYMPLPDGTLEDVTDLTPEEKIIIAKEAQDNRDRTR